MPPHEVLDRLSSILPSAQSTPPSAPDSRARLIDLSSEISELRRTLPLAAVPRVEARVEAREEDVPVTMPEGGWARLAGVLVEMARHHLVLEQRAEARAAAMDALLLFDVLEPSQTSAELSLLLGDVLLSLHEAHRAFERFEAAAEIYKAKGERRAEATARLALARALVQLNDPLARVILEDAGAIFEDVGDEAAVCAIDRELREVSAIFEESPASFQAVRRRGGSSKHDGRR